MLRRACLRCVTPLIRHQQTMSRTLPSLHLSCTQPQVLTMFATQRLTSRFSSSTLLNSVKSQTDIKANERKNKSDLLYNLKVVSDPEKYATDYLESLEGEELEFLKLIQFEYRIIEMEGCQLPPENKMSNERWLVLYSSCPSRNSRLKQYRYWAKLEFADANQKEKRSKRRVAEEQRRKEVIEKQNTGELQYANKIFLRISETTMNKHYYNNLFHSMENGCKLIYDFSFVDHMSFREMKSTIDQMLMAHNANKTNSEPFHLIWTNLKQDSNARKILTKAFPDYEDRPMTFTDKDYLELFPKEDLVWLSPDAPDVMRHYDPNTVYIIGGIVDTANQPPLTYARAKKEGIRAYRLPVDQYIQWEQGSKSLTLDQMMKIMLEIKQSGSWRDALMHVPQRKVRTRLH